MTTQKHSILRSFDDIYKPRNTMRNHSVKEKLLSLRKTIESNLYEKIADDRDIAEVADEILGEASTLIEKARNEQELIAIYKMLTAMLEIVSEDCERYGNPDLGYIQRHISDALYECIKPYLPHNVSDIELTKLLWPHNCRNITSLKDVFREYIFIHALILGPGDIFADEFISTYESEINKANKIQDLMRTYEMIKKEAREVALEHYQEGKRTDAWKYRVLSHIIGFLLSDFEHCLSTPKRTLKRQWE